MTDLNNYYCRYKVFNREGEWADHQFPEGRHYTKMM